MTATIFDTLKYAKELEAAGIPVPQAEAIVKAHQGALNEALDLSVATKNDINELKLEIKDIKADVLLMKWMLGFLLAGVTALIIRAFF